MAKTVTVSYEEFQDLVNSVKMKNNENIVKERDFFKKKYEEIEKQHRYSVQKNDLLESQITIIKSISLFDRIFNWSKIV